MKHYLTYKAANTNQYRATVYTLHDYRTALKFDRGKF